MRAVILALALAFAVANAGRSDKAAYAREMVSSLDCEYCTHTVVSACARLP